MPKKVIGYIYKTTFPNGKIYIGSDHCRTLDTSNLNYLDLIVRYEKHTYFGSSTNPLLEADMELWKDKILQRDILMPIQEWNSAGILIKKENEFIKKFKANDHEIGYNLTGRTCSIDGCNAAGGKFYMNGSGGWVCKKHYLKIYYNKKGKQQVKQRYEEDSDYRKKVLEQNKEYRESLPKEIKQEKRKQKYIKEKESGALKKYREVNRDRILENKRRSRVINAGKIATGKAKHHINNRDKIIRKLCEYQESMKGRHNALNSGAKKRGIPQHITFNQHYALISSDTCEYCAGSILHETGHKLDRKVSVGGEYHPDNCVPCCTICNMKKGSAMSYEEAKIVLAPKTKKLSELQVRPFNSKLSLDIANLAIDKLLQIPKMQILDQDRFEFMYGQTKVCIQPLFMKYPMAEWLEENALIFRPNEILNTFEQVESIITYRSGNISHKIGARSCAIASVDATTATVFFSQNHLMAHRLAPTIGLYYDGELVAALSYRLLYNKSFIEINRVAIKRGILVVGGVSKLISHVAKNHPQLPTILSFVDCRYHTGVSLDAAGFVRIDIPQGWMWTDGEKTYNRLACRANLDERALSEKDYALERGWYKIYDAGQAKYIKENSYYRADLANTSNTENTEIGVVTSEETGQKYSVYHATLRMDNYISIQEKAKKEGITLLSSIEDYTCGNYATRTISWQCSGGHTTQKLVRRFTDFSCAECLRLEKRELLQAKQQRLEQSVFSGTGIERKQKVYSRIAKRCEATNQTLVTTWEEFSMGEFSGSTRIFIKCQHGHTRGTTWAVVSFCGCPCASCKSERIKPNIFAGIEKAKKVNNTLIKFSYTAQLNIGDTFGNLTIKEVVNSRRVICSCSCNDVEVITAKDKLLRGLTKSCGCLKGVKSDEITVGVDAIATDLIESRLLEFGYIRIEGAVINESSKLRVKCLHCGAIKLLTWRSMGDNCIICVRKKATQNAYDKVLESAVKYGFTPIDTFEEYFKNCENKKTTRNSLVYIKLVCANGHPFSITAAAAKIRKWVCASCEKSPK